MNLSGSNTNTKLVDLTADIVSAYVANNAVSSTSLADFIVLVHTSLLRLALPPLSELPALQEPAVAIKKSVTPDYLICLEDGRKLKSLKRHLRSLGLSPDEYRQKWSLPDDYPMVAPNYSARRAQLAREIDLGRRGLHAKAMRAASVGSRGHDERRV